MERYWIRQVIVVWFMLVVVSESTKSRPDFYGHYFETWSFVGTCNGDCDTNNITSLPLGISCASTSLHSEWLNVSQGCPNIASSFVSDNPTNFETGTQANVIANVFSSIGKPGVAIVDFDYNSTYTMNILKADCENPKSWIFDHPQFDFVSALDLTQSTFSMALILSRIIEYEDPSNSEHFVMDNLNIINEYSFGTPGSSAYWLPTETFIETKDIGKQKIQVKASTSDGVISVMVECSTDKIAYNNGVQGTPKSSKITFSIFDFPYVQVNSKLAMELIVVTANTSGKIDFITEKDHLFVDEMDNQGFFSWSSRSVHQKSTSPVILSSWEPYNESDVILRTISASFLPNPLHFAARRTFATIQLPKHQDFTWELLLGIGTDINLNSINRFYLEKLVLMLILLSLLTSGFIAIRNLRKRRYLGDDESYKILLPP